MEIAGRPPGFHRASRLASLPLEDSKVGMDARHALDFPELLVDLERLAVVMLGLAELAPARVAVGAGAVAPRHVVEPPELLVQRERLPVHLLGPLEVAPLRIQEARLPYSIAIPSPRPSDS